MKDVARPRVADMTKRVQKEDRRPAAAGRHAAAGGPRGRVLASTVAGAKRQAMIGHGAISIATGLKKVETAGGSSTKPGPATQKMQCASTVA